MNSFNVYGQSTETIGGNTPIWLGTVKPIPVGATGVILGVGERISAGTLCIYDAATKTVTPVKSLGAGMEGSANAYIYNDLYREGNSEYSSTCAVVMHHPEGLMIERVYPDITEEQIAQFQSQIPGVLLVRG